MGTAFICHSCTPLAVLPPPLEDCHHILAKSTLHVIEFLKTPSAVGISITPLPHGCSGLSWAKGLLLSPETTRNVQEARSHARGTEVGLNNGPQ